MPRAHARAESSAERILDGAADEFAAAGFAGARIERIARRTRLNVRMIYYHFGSKRGLYRAVLERIYEQLSRALEALPPSESKSTLHVLGVYFDLMAEQPRFADVLVREVLDGAKHLKVLWREHPELVRRIHLQARDLVQAGVESGELGDFDPALTVMSVTSIVCFLTAARHSHALFLDGDDAQGFRQHLLKLLEDGLRRR